MYEFSVVSSLLTSCTPEIKLSSSGRM